MVDISNLNHVVSKVSPEQARECKPDLHIRLEGWTTQVLPQRVLEALDIILKQVCELQELLLAESNGPSFPGTE